MTGPAPTVGLALIAKDEEQTLPRLLASCEGAFDQIVLVDTGSSDATVAVFEEWAARQAPTRCEVAHFEWCDDFSAARQYADDRLDTDWKVWADCDDEIRGARNLRGIAAGAPEEVAAFFCGYHAVRNAAGETTCYTLRERLVRAGRSRWSAPVHEVQIIDGERRDVPGDVVEWVHRRTDDQPRFGRDIAILERHVNEHPEDARMLFYLAQSHRDAGNLESAIELYERRAGMGGWDEEVFQAVFQAGALHAQAGRWEIALARLVEASELRPTRVEPLLELALRLRERGEYQAAHVFAAAGLDKPVPGDKLFVAPAAYRWGVLFEYSITAYWVGEYDESLAACDRLLAMDDLPAAYRDQTVRNRDFCLERIAEAGDADAAAAA